MKNLLLIIGSLFAFTLEATTILKTHYQQRPIEIVERSSEISFTSPLDQMSFPRKECSTPLYQRFIRSMESKWIKVLALPKSVKPDFDVQFKGEHKKLTEHSEFGVFLKKSDQHFSILKREVDLACKK